MRKTLINPKIFPWDCPVIRRGNTVCAVQEIYPTSLVSSPAKPILLLIQRCAILSISCPALSSAGKCYYYSHCSPLLSSVLSTAGSK